jgi:accessory colonization factor AcfC
MIKKQIVIFFLTGLFISQIKAADTLYVYGPGGPYGPLNEAASKFSLKNNIAVKIIAGPEPNWINAAKQNADIFFGGAEYMMDNFIQKYPDLVNTSTREGLYIRGAGMLVRPGNPKNIKLVRDMAVSGLKIMVVAGSGQTGLWEDLLAPKGFMEEVRRNIFFIADNTATAIKKWKEDPSIDVWINYASWHYRLKDVTELISIREKKNIFRGTPILISKITDQYKESLLFISFLKTDEAHAIFKKWGWE